MTNENMILILELIRDHYKGTCKEALDMAISALKEEPVPFDFELFQAGLMDIPKGMTNREVIQALFPNATFKDAFIDTFTEITFIGNGYALLKKEWLNAPYQRGGK